MCFAPRLSVVMFSNKDYLGFARNKNSCCYQVQGRLQRKLPLNHLFSTRSVE